MKVIDNLKLSFDFFRLIRQSVSNKSLKIIRLFTVIKIILYITTQSRALFKYDFNSINYYLYDIFIIIRIKMCSTNFQT